MKLTINSHFKSNEDHPVMSNPLHVAVSVVQDIFKLDPAADVDVAIDVTGDGTTFSYQCELRHGSVLAFEVPKPLFV